MDKYGLPDEATNRRLVWHNNDPWACTMVIDESITHEFPGPHRDHLYQYIDYDVPAEKACDLIEFDGSILIDKTKGRFGSRCEMEEANILTLNLGMDIIRGRKSVEEAQEFFRETKFENKHPEYVQEFQFQVPATAPM